MIVHADLSCWGAFAVESSLDDTILCYYHWLWCGVDV